MGQLLAVVGVLLVFAFVGKALAGRHGGGGRAKRISPYRLCDGLLSKGEKAFFDVLQRAVAGDFAISMKVRLSDVLDVNSNLDESQSWAAWNRIQSKHVDFVLCRPTDYSFVCAVELDDKSHRRMERQDRDRFVDLAMADVGLPILHIPARSTYDADGLRQQIEDKIGSLSEYPPDVAPPKGTDSKCPKCGGDLILRTASRGKYAGRQFWGCSNYPRCRLNPQRAIEEKPASPS